MISRTAKCREEARKPRERDSMKHEPAGWGLRRLVPCTGSRIQFPSAGKAQPNLKLTVTSEHHAAGPPRPPSTRLRDSNDGGIRMGVAYLL